MIRVLGIWSLILALSLSRAAAADLDFQALQALIDRGQIDSIEGLLAALPSDYRSHYVLMYSSRSLQEASRRDPRVILYGLNAQLMISFNGDSAQRGYQDLETAEFDPAQNRFRLREVRFPAPRASDRTVEYSEVDPARCQRCHGTPARPIWDTPPLWPGAYGERYRSNLMPVERAGLQQFLNQQASHPRYRQLIGAERFAYRSTFVPDARSEYAGDAREPPNAEFSQLLSAMNMQMIAAQVRSRDGYAASQYALLGAAEGNCGRLEEFVPASQRAQVRVDLASFRAAAELADRRQYESKRSRAGADLSGTSVTAAASATDLTDFRYLAETQLGIATGQWTLALEKNTFDFASPRGGSAQLANALRAAVRRTDPQIEQLAMEREYSADDRYCSYLRERSQSAAASFTQGSRHPIAADAQLTLMDVLPEPLLEQCASCHVGGIAPAIPFDQPDVLATLLHRQAYPHGYLIDEIRYRLSPAAGSGRMPPDTNLTLPQRQALSSYLTGLAQTAD